MRFFILMLFLCQTSEAQSIVLSGDGRSIVLSGRSEAAPAAVQSPEVSVSQKAIPETQPDLSVVRETQKREQPENQHYLVSEAWCSHCPAAKARFEAMGWPKDNIITIAQAKALFGISVPYVPYEFVSPGARSLPPAVRNLDPPQSNMSNSRPVFNRSMPIRYIQWPGWGTIDLESYNRNCNCGMCRSIRAKQQEYQRQLREYQRTSAEAALPDDQKPCPMATVEAMLDLMQLTPDDTLADLGCGDGRILIAAAKRGVRGIGVELDHARVETARQSILDSGLSHLITIVQGDARSFDTSRATAITAYLYPTLLAELAPKMAAVRVAASPYHEVPGLAMIRVGDVFVHHKSI